MPTTEADNLVFTVDRKVAVWSLSTGKVIGEVGLPKAVATRRLPDEIRIWGDHASS